MAHNIPGLAHRLANNARLTTTEAVTAKVTAAVLVPLSIERDGKVNVWLTRRQASLSSHSGEVALPGGMRDYRETPTETALRESEEEIGLPRSSVEILGRLRPLRSLKGHLVLPLVGIVINPSFVPTVNPDEVESAFACPLETFVSTAGHHRKDIVHRGQSVSVHYFDKTAAGHGRTGNPVPDSYNIWGLTALFMIEAAEVILGREPAFEKVGRGCLDPWAASIAPAHHTQP